MEIQKYNKNSITVFDGSEKSIIKAIESELVNNLDDDTIEDKLLLLVKDAHLISGIKHSGDILELNTTVTEIIAELRFNKTNIRIDEVEIAFKNGVHKKYGDYFGLNAVTFCQFIKSYVLDQTRLEAIRLKNQPKEEKMQPTELEIFELSKSNALKAFKELQVNGTVGSFGGVVYDFLSKIKLIDLTQEEKNEYWKDAKEDYLKYLTIAMANPLDMSERNRLKKDLELFQNGEKKDRIISISKRLIVDDYYRGLIMEETDLEQELEAIKKAFKND